MTGINLHRFRDKAGISISGQPGGTLYLDKKGARKLAKLAAALARDLERRGFQESTFNPQSVEGD